MLHKLNYGWRIKQLQNINDELDKKPDSNYSLSTKKKDTKADKFDNVFGDDEEITSDNLPF